MSTFVESQKDGLSCENQHLRPNRQTPLKLNTQILGGILVDRVDWLLMLIQGCYNLDTIYFGQILVFLLVGRRATLHRHHNENYSYNCYT